MKQYSKRICLVMAMLLALPGFAGCGDAETETTAAVVTETAPETEEVIETTRAETKDNLPEIDLGGITVPILYRGCPADVIEVFAEELTGEPVSDAIYNRNLSVCERLNFQFDFIPNGTHPAAEFPQEAIASIAAGSDDFSIISWQQAQALKQCLYNRILDLKRYIDTHLEEDLDIDLLAERFYISKYHMMRLFRREVGVTIHTYLSHQRLLHARNLIQKGMRATEACYRSGFRSYSSFTRAYGAYFGTTPTGRTEQNTPDGEPLE